MRVWMHSVNVATGTNDSWGTWLNLHGYLIPDRVYLDITTGAGKWDFD